MDLEKKISEAVAFLGLRLPAVPDTALILGSGLSPLADSAEEIFRIAYGQIPHFPPSSVVGHAGEMVLARIGEIPVLFMRGRVHYYEGVPLADATLPIRVLRRLGVKNLIITNASGAIAVGFTPGDIVAISDHINMMGANPLIGYRPVGDEAQFIDLTQSYPEDLRALAHEEAKEMGLDLKDGIYAAMSGPSYETPAEIRMLRSMGADLIGMSTVPEVIVATQVGLKNLVLSCVSNSAAGLGDEPLTHEEVIETTARAAESFSELVRRIVNRLPA